MKKKIRLLHIDDNQFDRQLVNDALCKEHDRYEVISADNREKFEKHLNEKDFDLILSDFNILGFDGLQVLQIVHDKYPDMPVIIVTGTGSEEIAIKAMKMGASDYIIKSVKHIRGLAHTIEKVLENKNHQFERRKAIASLKKSEQKYRSLFENMQDVYYQIDKQDIIREISPSIYKLAGYKREELIGTPVISLYHDVNERKDMLELLSQKGEVWDFEVRLKAKSGQVKYASLNAHFMFDENNNQIGIEGSQRDIDKRKHFEMEMLAAKEKAEESDRLKTSFLHNISHEIRTPLNSIVGFSAILTDPETNPEKRKNYSDIISKSSDQLLSIIDDILNISAIEAGQEKPSIANTHINSILNLLVEQFSPKVKEKNISLHLETALPDDKSIVLTDETKFTQILTNLLENAFKFTQQGHLYFGYRIKENYLEFYVKDTGIGIPSEMQEAIFERFRQVETTETRQYGGSGLGLSISKAYVEMLGGKIWLESDIDKGSVFYFNIPYNITGQNIVTDIQPIKELYKETKNKIKLLIADDEELNLIYIEEILSAENFIILKANNGKEAIEICLSDPQIDLVLMDIKMPVLNGYEATKQIKKIRPGLPIIAQTAYSTESDKNKAYECGCSDFISKPFNKENFLEKIYYQLNNTSPKE